jgi:hypothetical protein
MKPNSECGVSPTARGSAPTAARRTAPRTGYAPTAAAKPRVNDQPIRARPVAQPQRKTLQRVHQRFEKEYAVIAKVAFPDLWQSPSTQRRCEGRRSKRERRKETGVLRPSSFRVHPSHRLGHVSGVGSGRPAKRVPAREVAKPYSFERVVRAGVPLRTAGLPHPLERRGFAMTARARRLPTGPRCHCEGRLSRPLAMLRSLSRPVAARRTKLKKEGGTLRPSHFILRPSHRFAMTAMMRPALGRDVVDL